MVVGCAVDLQAGERASKLFAADGVGAVGVPTLEQIAHAHRLPAQLCVDALLNRLLVVLARQQHVGAASAAARARG